jgi:hypothetical protein
MQQHELIEFFIRPLENAGLSYMVTGSVAAIFYGEPRLTHDIDIVIHLFVKDINLFRTLFPEKDFYCPPPEVLHVELLRTQFGHFNLIHHETGFKADCYPASKDPLHLWALKKRKRVALSDTLSVWLAPIEYVIVRKLQYFRDGGSQKHIEDIRKMLLVSGETVDTNFLTEEIASMGLQAQWKAAQ